MLVGDGTGSEPLAVSAVFDALDVGARQVGLCDVVVRGEVRGVRRRGRVLTFELVETDPAGQTTGVLRCVVFGADVPDVERAGLVDEAMVVADGRFDVDAGWGSVRLVVDAVRVEGERSDRAAAAEALLADLHAAGRLGAQRALVVPPRPTRVGLVAGVGTAGHADFMDVLAAAPNELQVVVRSTPMSGPRAASAVAGAIESLAPAGVDLIVVARGGGARADLGWADSEVVVRAIVECPVPVWTGIGHATDEVAADVVANRACPTPSAAADELVERLQLWEQDRHQFQVLREHSAQVVALRRSRRRVLVALVVLAIVVGVLVAVVVG